jgi:tetratricopeptide (TPR) repeat protein
MPATDLALEAAHELFYRCRFREVLRRTGGAAAARLPARVLAANALFELHEVAPALALMDEIAGGPDAEAPEALFVAGKLQYYRRQYDEALCTFQRLFESCPPDALRLRAVIGLANTHMARADLASAARIAGDVTRCLDLLAPDERISALILDGNLRMARGLDDAAAPFKSALSAALNQGWPYFALRALFGLACAAQRRGDLSATAAYLEVLDAALLPDECVYFSYLVNEQFKELGFAVVPEIELDADRKRIRLRGEWRSLHDKPMLFGFLEALHASPGFVPKEALATQLWPSEIYHPEVHDPRIFDLARRIRAVIEAYEDQPVALLSGRLGYKLATRGRADARP